MDSEVELVGRGSPTFAMFPIWRKAVLPILNLLWIGAFVIGNNVSHVALQCSFEHGFYGFYGVGCLSLQGNVPHVARVAQLYWAYGRGAIHFFPAKFAIKNPPK